MLAVYGRHERRADYGAADKDCKCFVILAAGQGLCIQKQAVKLRTFRARSRWVMLIGHFRGPFGERFGPSLQKTWWRG